MKYLRQTVETALRIGTELPVFYQRADVDTAYPYFVFEIRRLTDESGIKTNVLEVNGWDKADTSSRIEAKMDELEQKIHKLKLKDSARVILIHKGQKDPVDDEDKQIKRIRQQFQLTVCERSE